MGRAALGGDQRLDRAELFDEDYWTRDLRLGEHDEVLALVDNHAHRLVRVRKAFPRKRVLGVLARALGQSDKGVILMRKLWEREMRAIAEGRPIKAWRRPAEDLLEYGSAEVEKARS